MPASYLNIFPEFEHAVAFGDFDGEDLVVVDECTQLGGALPSATAHSQEQHISCRLIQHSVNPRYMFGEIQENDQGHRLRKLVVVVF
jgi:hypothetical protein